MNSAVVPTTRGEISSWKTRHLAMNERAKQGNVDLAFIGDSITEGWEGAGKEIWEKFYGSRKTINLGIGGDRTEHVIWRLTHGNLNGIKPKVAVLMIGTNNTGHLMEAPDEAAAGVQSILEILSEKLPQTTIVLHGLFPRSKSPHDAERLNNIAINDRIGRLADGERVIYQDIGEVFLEADGSIAAAVMPDSLHLSEDGYSRWASALEPTLVDLGL